MYDEAGVQRLTCGEASTGSMRWYGIIWTWILSPDTFTCSRAIAATRSERRTPPGYTRPRPSVTQYLE